METDNRGVVVRWSPQELYHLGGDSCKEICYRPNYCWCGCHLYPNNWPTLEDDYFCVQCKHYNTDGILVPYWNNYTMADRVWITEKPIDSPISSKAVRYFRKLSSCFRRLGISVR